MEKHIYSNIKILVLDDSTMMLRMMQSYLKNLGFYNVDFSTDPKNEISLFKKNKKVDLIFVDYMMRQLDGIKFVEETRYILGQKVPIIMISSLAEQSHIKRAYKAGVNDYIVKPFTQEIVLGHIEKFFKISTHKQRLIGQRFVDKGLISSNQLENALSFQKIYSSKHMKLSVLALVMGYVTIERLASILTEYEFDDDKFEKLVRQKKWLSAEQMGSLKKKQEQF